MLHHKVVTSGNKVVTVVTMLTMVTLVIKVGTLVTNW